MLLTKIKYEQAADNNNSGGTGAAPPTTQTSTTPEAQGNSTHLESMYPTESGEKKTSRN